MAQRRQTGLNRAKNFKKITKIQKMAQLWPKISWAVAAPPPQHLTSNRKPRTSAVYGKNFGPNARSTREKSAKNWKNCKKKFIFFPTAQLWRNVGLWSFGNRLTRSMAQIDRWDLRLGWPCAKICPYLIFRVKFFWNQNLGFLPPKLTQFFGKKPKFWEKKKAFNFCP